MCVLYTRFFSLLSNYYSLDFAELNGTHPWRTWWAIAALHITIFSIDFWYYSSQLFPSIQSTIHFFHHLHAKWKCRVHASDNFTTDCYTIIVITSSILLNSIIFEGFLMNSFCHYFANLFFSSCESLTRNLFASLLHQKEQKCYK